MKVIIVTLRGWKQPPHKNKKSIRTFLPHCQYIASLDYNSCFFISLIFAADQLVFDVENSDIADFKIAKQRCPGFSEFSAVTHDTQ